MKIVKIQPKERDDCTLPYPFFIAEHGEVQRQDFWNGNPKWLVGFMNGSEPTKKNIDNSILFPQFWDDPKECIDKYPIFKNEDGSMFNLKDSIENVEIQEW